MYLTLICTRCGLDLLQHERFLSLMAGFTPFTAQLALSSLLLVDILTLPQADLATALYWMPQRALVLSLSLLHC